MIEALKPILAALERAEALGRRLKDLEKRIDDLDKDFDKLTDQVTKGLEDLEEEIESIKNAKDDDDANGSGLATAFLNGLGTYVQARQNQAEQAKSTPRKPYVSDDAINQALKDAAVTHAEE